jgi:hypothetical protein
VKFFSEQRGDGRVSAVFFRRLQPQESHSLRYAAFKFVVWDVGLVQSPGQELLVSVWDWYQSSIVKNLGSYGSKAIIPI